MGKVVIKNPSADYDTWIDDLPVEGHADDDNELDLVMTKATNDLKQAVREELLLEFSDEKQAVVTTTAVGKKIARKVSKQEKSWEVVQVSNTCHRC